MLPEHGKLNCTKCFGSSGQPVGLNPKWKIKNDPGAWGSSQPQILVLGFSKGNTQSNIYDDGAFNDVAFGGLARNRLDLALKSVGLLNINEHVTDMISDRNSRMAFGSLVRCSLTREDKNGNHVCSGALINKSFKEIPEVLDTCTAEYLRNLPSETKLVILLGVGDAYIKNCRTLLAKHSQIEEINSVSYRVNGRIFVHLTHPSPGNGHFNAWLSGGHKQTLATAAINMAAMNNRTDL